MAENPDKGAFEGAYVMAMLSAKDAKKLAVPNGDAADTMHVTLGFFTQQAAEFDPAQRTEIEGKLGDVQVPIAGRSFATAVFNADGGPDGEMKPCSVVLVQSDALAAAHDAVEAAVGPLLSRKFPIWIPHVALGYELAGVPADRSGRELTFDRLVMAWGNEQKVVGAVDLAVSPGGRPADASPLGKKGGPRRLSDYVREIAHALMREHGFSESHAIAVARNATVKWAAKSKNPAVRAGAAKSIAEMKVLDHVPRGKRKK